MRYFFTLVAITLSSAFSFAQFQPAEKGLTIIVTDGSKDGRNSELVKKAADAAKKAKKGPKDGPSSYGATGGRINPALVLADPIVPLGMNDAIQIAAFLKRPEYGKAGFLLIFCVNDSIGGEFGEYEVNGETHKGVYRLIRQKFTPEEPIPAGMSPHKLEGTFFILGVS